MKRKRLIWISLGIIILGLVLYIFLGPKSPNNAVVRFTPLPAGQLPEALTELPKGEKITVGDQEINNIYNLAVTTNKYGDVVYSETPDYQQTYFYADQYFNITVLTSPFTEGRKVAEEQFLRSTGITQEQACKLDVRVGTIYDVNPNEAGTDYKLSFCE